MGIENGKAKEDEDAYLIFVIFFTQAKFSKKKIYTELYTVNCQFTQKIANLHRKLPIFRIKSVKIYTGPKNFTPALPVTNMRYEYTLVITSVGETLFQTRSS